ncbi:MAG: nicotinate phosphoribosyltransferase [Candidatus Kerfeldbacteria bacterium]|nr:nicotinate phosphoribosyltransferase [Candidatus Kerfeldbacteria bacterium]
MINDFLRSEDLSLFTSSSRFALASVFFDEGLADKKTTFDLFVRELPKTRNFLVFAGLEHVAEHLLNLRIDSARLRWLRKTLHFPPNILKYFKSYRFTGDLWAMREGTIFFAQEPIVRITAPLVEAQLIEMLVTNEIYVQTILASKISRFVRAANGKQVGIGFNRTYGLDAAMRSARINEIFGITNTLATYHYKHESSPFYTGTFHYLIMAFDEELDAIRAYLRGLGGKGYVLVDTYDTVQGIKKFITAAKELELEGKRAVGVQLDSGDLHSLSVQARKMLDEANLPYAKIFAMGNLDEWKVQDLERRKAPIDFYAGVTELLVPTDAPTLEMVYKMSEIERQGKMMPVMKTSTGKASYPGRKQIYRILRGKKYYHDALGLEDEPHAGKKLLVPIIRNGKLVYKFPSLQEIGGRYRREANKFSPQLFNISTKARYGMRVSPALQRLTHSIARSRA